MSLDNASNPDLALFSSLPLDPNGPPAMLGVALELQTNWECWRSSQASASLSTGRSTSLSIYPSYGRDLCTRQSSGGAKGGGLDRVVNIDILTFNTQSSTQWDGFRYYGLLAFIHCLKMAVSSCDLAEPNERVFKRATILHQIHSSSTLDIGDTPFPKYILLIRCEETSSH
jgi:hypothetical protein